MKKIKVRPDDLVNPTSIHAFDGNQYSPNADMELEDDWFKIFHKSLRQHQEAVAQENERLDKEVAAKFELDFIQDADKIIDEVFYESGSDTSIYGGNQKLLDRCSQRYWEMIQNRASERTFAKAQNDWNLGYSLLEKFATIYEHHRSLKLQS